MLNANPNSSLIAKLLVRKSGSIRIDRTTGIVDNREIDRRIISSSGQRIESVSDDKGETISVRKYPGGQENYANGFLLLDRPWYIVEKSDLNEKLRTELIEEITSEEARQYVLKEAVGRIFENLNFQEYHLSIARKS